MFRSARVLASARRALHARAPSRAYPPRAPAAAIHNIRTPPPPASRRRRRVPSHGGGGARTSHRSGGIVTISSITLASRVTTPRARAGERLPTRTKSSCCTSGLAASSASGRQARRRPSVAGEPVPRAKSVPGGPGPPAAPGFGRPRRARAGGHQAAAVEPRVAGGARRSPRRRAPTPRSTRCRRVLGGPARSRWRPVRFLAVTLAALSSWPKPPRSPSSWSAVAVVLVLERPTRRAGWRATMRATSPLAARCQPRYPRWPRCRRRRRRRRPRARATSRTCGGPRWFRARTIQVRVPAQTDPERDVPSSLCSDRGARMPCHTAEGTECIAAASPP